MQHPASRAISVPSTSMTPCCGAAIPASKLRKVDLPLPDGPISKRRSPLFKEKPSIDSVKAFRPGQVNRTSDICDDGRGGYGRFCLLLSGGFECDHMLPVRSRLELSRLTSKLDWPLGEITVISSSCAPGKALKYSKCHRG